MVTTCLDLIILVENMGTHIEAVHSLHKAIHWKMTHNTNVFTAYPSPLTN